MILRFLYLAVFFSQVSYGQDDSLSIDTAGILIPRIDIEFKKSDAHSTEFLSSNMHHIGTAIENDSIYVYQNKSNKIYLAIGNDHSYLISSIYFPHLSNGLNTQTHFDFELDSLGSKHPYLTIKWMTRSFSEHSTYSGSKEYLCHETINKHELNQQGITIISLISRKILFQGLTEIHSTESQIRNPGRSKKTIYDEEIKMASHWLNSPYLTIHNHGNENYYGWTSYKDLPFGIYQIVNDQYVLTIRN